MKKKSNRIARGNYYQRKSVKWLEKEGWEVAKLETRQMIYTKDGSVIPVTRDVFGADLLAVNDEEIMFIQHRTNQGDILSGLKKLQEHRFPKFVKLVVMIWEYRAREPSIHEAEEK